MIKRLKGYFLTGLLVLIPLVLTGYIIWRLFLAIDGLLRGVVNNFLLTKLGLQLAEKPIPGLGFLALVLLILLTGIIARNYLGKRLLNLGDKIVTQIPLVNRIYGAIQQISRAFFSERREVFKKAVLVEYPRKGIYSIGLFTQDTKGQVQDSLDEDVVSVFLPTTPNPTSGYLLFVPKSNVIDLDLPVEEALKLVVSAGAIIPQDRRKAQRIITRKMLEREKREIEASPKK